jgi:DNA-binding MarR family transcriptional regulator
MVESFDNLMEWQMDATPDLLNACKRFIQAADLCEERVANRLGIGRSDLRAINLLEEGPLRQGALARRLGLTAPTVTALIDRLVADGFVQRSAHPTDRRITLVELLPTAWGRLAAVYQPIGNSVLAAAAHLDAAEQHQLMSVLHDWADALDQQPSSQGRLAAGPPGDLR